MFKKVICLQLVVEYEADQEIDESALCRALDKNLTFAIEEDDLLRPWGEDPAPSYMKSRDTLRVAKTRLRLSQGTSF